MSDQSSAFWETKTLEQMTNEEWESLCDGCGQCCVVQLENPDTNQLFFTDVSCRLLDVGLCRCKSYENRQEEVPSCMMLSVDNVRECAEFAPPTCAYRLLVEGKRLFPWHPLISGDSESVHKAGMSVRNKVESEESVDFDNIEQRIIDFP